MDLGFADLGVAPADGLPGWADDLARFTDQGRHGTMTWLADRQDQRASPKGLWPEVRSVISLGTLYTPGEDPLLATRHPDRGAVSIYARNRDYHDVIKGRLKTLGQWMASRFGCALKVFVDTAPVMEKPLAHLAGLGWQGRHGNLVSRRHGNWLFLSEIYTTLDLPPGQPEPDRCGRCTACADACPSQAIDPVARRVDPRRCISYLTIEHHGPIAPDLRAAMGNRVYGCDDCLAVCPWNKFAAPQTEDAFLPRIELTRPALADLADLDDPGFRQVFSGSPIKRIGIARLLRNVLTAMGNSGNQTFLSALVPYLDHPDPTVADAAVWARARLSGGPHGDDAGKGVA